MHNDTLKKHNYDIPNEKLGERFLFRSIKPEEADQAVAIEQICFPPNEACSEKHMKERIIAAPDLFMVAIDRETGKLAGFLNGIATSETKFRDEFFTDAGLYEPDGKNVMLLGLDVLPKYRGQGLGREIVYEYLRRERANNRKRLVLTCLKEKVDMYLSFGFVDLGIADSSWGGEEWHEMEHEMGYEFYGWEGAFVPSVSEEYKGIKDPRHLYDLLSRIWCADTCAPRMRSEWCAENKTLGQCSITAFLAQDIFGGEVYGILRPGGNYHCYNVVGDCVFDLTSEQFGDEKLDYSDNPKQSREVHFAKEEKRLRYEFIRDRLKSALA